MEATYFRILASPDRRNLDQQTAPALPSPAVALSLARGRCSFGYLEHRWCRDVTIDRDLRVGLERLVELAGQVAARLPARHLLAIACNDPFPRRRAGAVRLEQRRDPELAKELAQYAAQYQRIVVADELAMFVARAFA
jgi:hypothetical protein